MGLSTDIKLEAPVSGPSLGDIMLSEQASRTRSASEKDAAQRARTGMSRIERLRAEAKERSASASRRKGTGPAGRSYQGETSLARGTYATPTWSIGGSSGSTVAGGGGSLAKSFYRDTTSAGTTSAGAATAGPAVSKEALAALSAAKEQYAPGGDYSSGLEAGLDRSRKKAMASGMQNLVSAGLANTTMGASMGRQFEEEVAMPARADLESRRASALSGLSVLEAQMEQGGSQSALNRSLALEQQKFGIASSEAQSLLSRDFALSQADLARKQQTREADLDRQVQMNQMLSRTSTSATPTQHISGSSGIGSFLENLRSQDIMSAPDWNF